MYIMYSLELRKIKDRSFTVQTLLCFLFHFSIRPCHEMGPYLKSNKICGKCHVNAHFVKKGNIFFVILNVFSIISMYTLLLDSCIRTQFTV